MTRRPYTPGPDSIWTDANVQILRDRFAGGDSFSEIGRLIGLGCTRNAAISKAKRLGLHRDHLIGLENNARTKTREALSKNRVAGLAAVARNVERRSPDKPLPHARPDNVSTFPKHWSHRRFGECAFPVGGKGADLLSCCESTDGATYCAAHRKIMFAKPATPAQRTAAANARAARQMKPSQRARVA